MQGWQQTQQPVPQQQTATSAAIDPGQQSGSKRDYPCNNHQATLTLHDVRIARAQTAADVAALDAASAQPSAEQAQQTANQALDKTKYCEFTQDSIQNLQQPTLELTCSIDAFIHINKSLRVTDSITCDSLLLHTWRAPRTGSQAELRYTSNNLPATCDSLQVQAATASTQFSVSNACCYVAGYLMPGTATVKAIVSSTQEGAIKVTADALRFYTASNGSEKLLFSANSNGLSLLCAGPLCSVRCSLGHHISQVGIVSGSWSQVWLGNPEPAVGARQRCAENRQQRGHFLR